LDNIGHGVGLAGASYAQKGLVFFALLKAISQMSNCRRLVASGLIIAFQMEFGHLYIVTYSAGFISAAER